MLPRAGAVCVNRLKRTCLVMPPANEGVRDPFAEESQCSTV